MESASTECTHDAASDCGWSLKKLKPHKVQASRALKLRGGPEEQDRHSRRSDVDHALIDHQQHLRRLKQSRADIAGSHSSPPRRQRLPPDVENGLPTTAWDFSRPLTSKLVERDGSHQTGHGLTWSRASTQVGKGATTKKQHQRQSMGAAVESRRRLARGPRSGSTIADGQAGGQSMLPLEDHRVVSTDYQAAGTQALMRVTLLAAGFVIGARGISVRLIGQVTGAIVQSWTESCRPDSIPIRLFRIQGKKAVVQTAVALIEQAVVKYKDLCECKRRGEFVQREHVINGVEFYYQPPPRKAFANNGNELSPKAEDGPGVQLKNHWATAASFPPHHVWLQHLQEQQQHQAQTVAAQQQKQQAHLSLLEASQGQVVKGENGVDCRGQDPSDVGHQSQVFFDWQPKVERQLIGLQSPDLDRSTEFVSEFELLDHGLQQSVASLEQALQQVRLEQHLLQRKRTMGNNNNNNNNMTNCNNNDSASHLHCYQGQKLLNHKNNQIENNGLWPETTSDSPGGQQSTAASTAFHLGPSLFFFEDGGLPLPISPTEVRSVADNNCIFMDATPCTPFDFPHNDFLRDSLPNFPRGAARKIPECSLYEASPLLENADVSLCIVCIEHQASVQLMPCGHNLFCFSCVGGLLTCPLCRQPIVALHPRGSNPLTPEVVGLPNDLNVSSHSEWNKVPGA
ncbi:uncharacterized protein [Physcomitrium patens]|uniref:RING-type domain-containing protein n=2 Tax=Physcomitrium patens TaxID=3218 RepID=A0A7I4D3M0_PHYPA|nr:uncharacterized protein LOC112278878 [Physcomitrium patens]XP_024368516.1 uncharacterized protein LOC112278878 [Physcomitrium patens]XP_024368517.1 uncharacterized protein LOC112278878 [Physcomitrium patens]|eukprot:XP_024368515.1 uncharacterized protein LOC112278878 [Physcomitrella patens]